MLAAQAAALQNTNTKFEANNLSVRNMNKTDDADNAKLSTSQSSKTTQKLLGGLSPKQALQYIKNTPDVVIVQVNTAQWKIEPGFTGAIWIPHDEMQTRYNEIPRGRPVILHCGAGVVSVPAYKTLIEKRPDIPELSYIAGRPHEIMQEYNSWRKSK